MKNLKKASLWLLLTGVMMFASVSCDNPKSDNKVSVYSYGGKMGFIDKTGKIAIEPIYDTVQPFNEGLASVSIDGKWGFIDTTGYMVIKPQFDRADYFFEGLASVNIDGKWGFIDKTDKIVIEPQFDNTNGVNFFEGLANVKIEDKWGFIDKTGEIVIEPRFDYAFIFSEGLAKVEIDGKIGFIDKTGKMVIEPQVMGAENFFKEGLIFVEYGADEYGFIDRTGKIVIEDYDSWHVGNAFVVPFVHQCFSEGLCPAYIPEKFGLNKRITEPIYDEIEELSSGVFFARSGYYYFVIDKSGNVIEDSLYIYNEGEVNEALIRYDE